MIKHYILEGREIKEVDLMTWARWFETSKNRFIAETHIGQKRVSTIFLGIDHNWSDTGPPILFETMVFGLDAGWAGEQCECYATYDQAELGHKRFVLELSGAPVV